MNKFYAFLAGSIVIFGCSSEKEEVSEQSPGRFDATPVIIDTDANNELDDQHALAYLFMNKESFNVVGVTVNATRGGGPVEEHYAEAERVMKLCNVDKVIPLLKGANGNFNTIENTIIETDFDGKEAVNFIISEARRPRKKQLVLLPVGKLTNIALALKLAPEIKSKVRIVWLGSNYPDTGEYNLENDTSSLNYILHQQVPIEIVTVSYGKKTGSDFVRVTPDEIQNNLEGEGPAIQSTITGRHGKSFNNFGDYSVNLFQNINLNGTPPGRALYDMVAVAILKNPDWGEKTEIPMSIYSKNGWKALPKSQKKITVWENFDKDAIMEDFYTVIKNAQ